MKINTPVNHWNQPLPRRGFTLVELLLVLTILAILAGIVLPKFASRGEQARETAADAQINVFQTALSAFEVDTGHYPRGRDGLQALIVQPRDAMNWRGPYLEKDSIPNDPWGGVYTYECPGKHNPSGYDIYCTDPNNQKLHANWTIRNQ